MRPTGIPVDNAVATEAPSATPEVAETATPEATESAKSDLAAPAEPIDSAAPMAEVATPDPSPDPKTDPPGAEGKPGAQAEDKAE